MSKPLRTNARWIARTLGLALVAAATPGSHAGELTLGTASLNLHEAAVVDAIAAGEIVRDAEAQPAGDAPAATADAPPEPKPDPVGFFSGWTGSVEGGLNGSSGNTERLSVRAGLNAARDTSKMVTKFSTFYIYAQDDGDKSEDRGEILLRNDWKFGAPDNRWRYFVQGKAEYDTFQDWTWRVSLFTGLGYELIKTDTTLFVPKVGVGITKEFGGSENKIIPELLLGWDLEHKFNPNVSLTHAFNFYPALDDFGDYRFDTNAALAVLLSEENKLTLKLGVEDRYDSTPNGRKRNDITYFALISWAF